jgi:hypothetical protein
MSTEQEQEVVVVNSGNNAYLDDLLASIDAQEVQELGLDSVNENYVIRDMGHANYIAKKLREVREEQVKINEAANTEIKAHTARVETWRERSVKPLVDSEAYLLGLLQEFASRQLEGSSKKSIKLIEGTAQFRKVPDKFEYDEEVLLTFLQTDLPSYIKQKPQVDKTELKKAGSVKDGVLYVGDKQVPGVVVTPQEDRFDVK